MDMPCLLSRSELKQRQIPFSNQHLLEMEQQNKFPKRVVLGPKTVRWVADEIDAWLAERMVARNSEQQAA